MLDLFLVLVINDCKLANPCTLCAGSDETLPVLIGGLDVNGSLCNSCSTVLILTALCTILLLLAS